MTQHHGAPDNLRPYGNPFGNAPVQTGAAEEVALQRAAHKLEQIRRHTSGDFPIGFNRRRFAMLSVLVLIPFAFFLLLGIALIVTGETPPVGIVFVLFSGIIALIPVSVIFRSRPRTPKAALLEFYRTLSRGESKRALALLTNADRDSSTRIQPKIAELGRPNGYPLPFSDPNAFAAYWNELLRTHPAPYCVVRMSDIKVQQIAPDVAVVDYKLTLTMNTSLYYLLILLGILVGVLLAFAIDAMTRKVVKADLRKVLVRVGDEWKLFNGEWQGYEEYDLRWLPAA